ncbi:MAG: hypothetical protein R3D85_11540 [Paracoccaceae bacterium]
MKTTLLTAAVLISGLALSARAQTVLNGNHSIQGKACIGQFCDGSETFPADEALKLNAYTVGIGFEDASDGTGYPDRDWRILVNDDVATASGGINRFSVKDMGSGNIPFTIVADAPANALWVGDLGWIGMGTSLPEMPLHIKNFISPRIRLDNSAGTGAAVFDIGVQSGVMNVVDVNTGRVPMRIYAGADQYLLTLTNAGGVGIGTNVPQGWLTVNTGAVPTGLVVQKGSFSGIPAQAFAHFRTDQGTAQLMVEETSTTTTPRTLMNLQNNGRPEIVMGNTGTGGEWSFGAGTNFILKQGAVGSASNAKTKLFEIDPSGNATLTGSLTTGGPSCATGCDAVFDPGYDLPTITDHAAQMFQLGHLPNVGSTKPGEAMNVSDKMGRILNELEHAHIFIAQQQAVIVGQSDDIALLKREVAALKQARSEAD